MSHLPVCWVLRNIVDLDEDLALGRLRDVYFLHRGLAFSFSDESLHLCHFDGDSAVEENKVARC